MTRRTPTRPATVARFAHAEAHVGAHVGAHAGTHAGTHALAYAFAVAFAVTGTGITPPRLHAQTAKPLPTWGALTPGQSSVGFSSWVERDSARITDGHARAVQVSVWYPSTGPALTPRLSYADYVALGATETGQPASDSASTNAVRKFSDFLVSNGVPADDIRRWLASPMHARLDAAAAPRSRRGLVLVAQGNAQAAYSQAVLCEYLASRGFVVVTSPSPIRLGAALTSDADIFPLASEQANDLEVAMRAAVKRGLTDSARVATVGHSLGARASLLLVLRKRATLLVSLDGGIANAQGKAWLDGAPVDLAKARGRLVHIFQEGDSVVVPDFATVHQLTGMDRLLIRADGLRHWSFTSFGTSAAAFPTVAPGPTNAKNERTSADVVLVVSCVLDAWSRGAGRQEDEACLAGKTSLNVRERLPAKIRVLR